MITRMLGEMLKLLAYFAPRAFIGGSRFLGTASSARNIVKGADRGLRAGRVNDNAELSDSRNGYFSRIALKASASSTRRSSNISGHAERLTPRMRSTDGNTP